MELTYDLGGLTTLSIAGLPSAMERGLTRAMRPWPPIGQDTATTSGASPAIRIEASTVAPHWTHVVGATWDGRRTASDGQSIVSLLDPGWWALRREGDRFAVTMATDTPTATIVSDIVKPLAMVAIADAGGATLHASAIADGPSATLFAGWSEAGKTETALAFAESGARICSDKWSGIRPDGVVVGFPGPIAVRSWVLPSLPRLRSAVTTRMRAQRAAASVARFAPRLVGTFPGPSAAEVARRLEALVELGGRLRLDPDMIATATGARPAADHPVVRRVVLLRASSSATVTVATATVPEVVAALQRSAAIERAPWLTIIDRGAYLAPGVDLAGLDPGPRESVTLPALLTNVELIAVDAPYPTDPRRVRDAIMAAT